MPMHASGRPDDGCAPTQSLYSVTVHADTRKDLWADLCAALPWLAEHATGEDVDHALFLAKEAVERPLLGIGGKTLRSMTAEERACWVASRTTILAALERLKAVREAFRRLHA